MSTAADKFIGIRDVAKLYKATPEIIDTLSKQGVISPKDYKENGLPLFDEEDLPDSISLGGETFSLKGKKKVGRPKSDLEIAATRGTESPPPLSSDEDGHTQATTTGASAHSAEPHAAGNEQEQDQVGDERDESLSDLPRTLAVEAMESARIPPRTGRGRRPASKEGMTLEQRRSALSKSRYNIKDTIGKQPAEATARSMIEVLREACRLYPDAPGNLVRIFAECWERRALLLRSANAQVKSQIEAMLPSDAFHVRSVLLAFGHKKLPKKLDAVIAKAGVPDFPVTVTSNPPVTPNSATTGKTRSEATPVTTSTSPSVWSPADIAHSSGSSSMSSADAKAAVDEPQAGQTAAGATSSQAAVPAATQASVPATPARRGPGRPRKSQTSSGAGIQAFGGSGGSANAGAASPSPAPSPAPTSGPTPARSVSLTPASSTPDLSASMIIVPEGATIKDLMIMLPAAEAEGAGIIKFSDFNQIKSLDTDIEMVFRVVGYFNMKILVG